MKQEHLGFAILAVLLIGGLVFVKISPSADRRHSEASRVVVAGSIVISDFWIAEPIGGQRQTSLYLTLRNASASEERLLGASTNVAAMTHLHRTSNEDNISRMEWVGAIIIPAEGELRFEPGGLHIMLMGLREPVASGDMVDVTLELLENGEVTFETPVLSRAEALNW